MYKVTLFGEFEIARSNGEAFKLNTRNAELLLTYCLVNAETPLSRERLANLFWPEASEQKAKQSLRQTLYILRKHLEKHGKEYFYSDKQNIRFSTQNDFFVDAIDFEKLIKTARKAIEHPIPFFEEAVLSYKGDILVSSYDDWVLELREYYKSKYLRALNRLTSLYERAEQYSHAINTAYKSLTINELQESMHLELAKVYFKVGKISSAVQQLKKCSTLLKTELGLELSDESSAFLDKLLETREPTEKTLRLASPLSNLPAETSSFVGREFETQELLALHSTSRLITLTGAGGTGKSRLAINLSRKLKDEYPFGAWGVELNGISEKNAILSNIALILKIPERPGISVLESICESIYDKKLLLLFDNCEHLLNPCMEICSLLLRECPNLVILTTSRIPLELEAESIYRVEPFIVPDNISSKIDAEQNPAIQLFVHRAKQAKPSFQLTEENYSSVVYICSRLDGIPLAIELAASRANVLPPQKLVDRLADRFRFLTRGRRDSLAHQKTLRATIDWSYDMLEEAEKLLLCRLSVFQGGFAMEAAEAVCAGEGLDELEVLDYLSQLVQKSLVEVDERGDEARYRLLETVRQYAQEKLEATEEIAKLPQAHLDYYLELAETAEPELEGAGQSNWLQLLHQEHDNFRGALHWAIQERQRDAAQRMAGALGRFWSIRGHWSEGREWLNLVLDKESGGSLTVANCKALLASGVLAHNQGKYVEAYDEISETLKLSETLEFDRGCALSHKWLGTIHARLGRLDEAVEEYDKARNYFEDAGIKSEEGHILMNLGAISQMKGDYEAAFGNYEAAAETFSSAGNEVSIAKCLSNKSLLNLTLGQYQSALDDIHHLLKLSMKLGDVKAEAVARMYKGISLESIATKGNPRLITKSTGLIKELVQAAQDHREALEIFRSLKDKVGESAAHYNIGSVCLCMGDIDEAIDSLNLSIDMSRITGLSSRIAHCLSAICRAHIIIGEHELAYKYSLKAFNIWSNESNPQIMENQFSHGLALEAIGQKEASLIFFKKAFNAVQLTLGKLSSPYLKESYSRANWKILQKWTQLER